MNEIALAYYAQHTMTHGTAMQIAATEAVAEIERLRANARELDRLMLVIESAVRHSDPINHAAVMALILANRDSVSKMTPNAEVSGLRSKSA